MQPLQIEENELSEEDQQFFKRVRLPAEKDILVNKLKSTAAVRKNIFRAQLKIEEDFPFYFVDPELVSIAFVFSLTYK